MKPMAFYSHKLTQPLSNYVAYKLECLAIYTSVKHFRVYLLAHEFLSAVTIKHLNG